MENNSVLERIGLSKKERAAYLALLRLGPATVSQIARQSGLHRPTIYQVLPALKEKGLVALFPHGRKSLYAAENPKKLERMIETTADEFGRLLPDLEQAYASKRNRPLVKFFEGKKGLMNVFDDLHRSQKRGDIYYRYGSRKQSTDITRYFPLGYREAVAKKGLEHYVITSQAIAAGKRPKFERAIKVIPAEEGPFDFDISHLIYADKIAFIDYNSETALVVQNRTIAEYQKKLFKLLFERL